MIADASAGARKKTRFFVLMPLVLMIAIGWWSMGYGRERKLAPEITGQKWINAAPLHLADLKGKVVLVEFWTFGCYNCRNVEPYVKTWHKKYADQGLVIVGVHTPETERERASQNVERYVRDQQIAYAVVTDNDFAIWTRYGNQAWPTIYLIDKQGFLRYRHIGEGSYGQTEQQIRALLAEQ